MIRLSGVEDIEIIETGLRPGERLYKELLVETEKLEILRAACEVEEDDGVREAMRKVVLTF